MANGSAEDGVTGSKMAAQAFSKFGEAANAGADAEQWRVTIAEGLMLLAAALANKESGLDGIRTAI